MTTDLCKIMTEYGSDKGSGWHNYTPFYEEIFKNKRYEPLDIFELGLGTNNPLLPSSMGPEGKPGASLRGWKEYFTNSKIYGADIDKNILFQEDRIKTFYCDQLSSETIKNMWNDNDLKDKEFDIIIDDGLHQFQANINFFRNSIHKLKKTGVYIIEDIHIDFIENFKNLLPFLKEEFDYLTFELKEIPNPKNRSDNNLIVIKYLDSLSNDEKLIPTQTTNITKNIQMSKLIDCFTFYNELEILELRMSEIYDVIDKFIIVEADKTFKGDSKPFIFDENKGRFEKWMDKIIHVKVNFPVLNSNNPWDYEKYQRNSFMPSLYFLNLSENDKIIISDVDEIPDSSTLSYVKPYPMSGICKLEMDQYFGSFRNKLNNPEKWYHPKILTWGHLKSTTPDNCRNDFNCQWWEKGGWHLSYFGGSEKIVQKIKSFSHQEYNNPQINNTDRIEDKIRNNQDFLDDWRTFVNIEPEKNPYLPKNWRILEKYEEEYFPEFYNKKDLVIGAAINTPIENTMTFLRSFRKHNNSADIFLLVEKEISQENTIKIKNLGANLIFTTLTDFLNTPINNTRYLKFYEFVKEHHEEYGNILITDVRDVYFQGDPFLSTEKNSIFFAQEEEEKIIKEDIRFNSRWIQQTYGKEILEKIGNEKITCCGTVLGSSINCLSYLKFINDEILRFYRDKIESFGDMLDTAIHTYLFYTNPGILKNPQMKVNGDIFGTVGITIQEFPEKILIREGKIEVNGKKPPVIHQYDRSEWLTSFIKNNL